MLIFDVHLDLSMNAIEWNRDLRQPASALRAAEAGLHDMKGRGSGTVTLPDMRRGRVGLCVATQIAGCMKPRGPVACWESPPQAYAMTQAQLAWYEMMEELGEMRQIRDLPVFEEMLALWTADEVPGDAPIGYILSLEGADSILTPAHVERAHARGLRAIGPAHYGEGRYAFGHDRVGGLKPGGRELLLEMDRLGMILDATHLSDGCFWEALDIFQGPVWASHSNSRTVVPDVRQFSDEQIKALIDRGAVLGSVYDTWMMVPGWVRGRTTPEETGVKIADIYPHIDRICQIAGNARHVGIGSDLDGGFGKEQSPLDLDTIADLQSLAGVLRSHGYGEADVAGVMHGNFVRFVREAWG